MVAQFDASAREQRAHVHMSRNCRCFGNDSTPVLRLYVVNDVDHATYGGIDCMVAPAKQATAAISLTG
jgi:hypothetical protein